MAEGVLLSWLSDGWVRSEFMSCVLAAMLDPECPVTELDGQHSGPDLKATRNEQVGRFLDTGLDWLWMVDTDMVFLPGALPALLEAADPVTRPVMGGLCFQQVGRNKITPTLHYVRRLGGDDFVFRTPGTWPEDTVVPVDATGTGFLLVHRGVFDAITVKAAPGEGRLWFAEIVNAGRQFSEDLSFCLRAAAAGIPVHVHTGVRVGHLKTACLGDIGVPGG